MKPPFPTVAVLLAAGGGTRFEAATGTHKLLADLRGRPVHRHAVDSALESGLDVVVVTGAVDLDLPPAVHRAHNPGWATGQAGSLQIGIAIATSLGAEAVVVGLADQPFVPADAWRTIASAHPEWSIVVASYDGRRGPTPVRLHRSIWSLLPLTGDEGARTLIRTRSELVHELSCAGSADDIDTLEDLQRWTSS